MRALDVCVATPIVTAIPSASALVAASIRLFSVRSTLACARACLRVWVAPWQLVHQAQGQVGGVLRVNRGRKVGELDAHVGDVAAPVDMLGGPHKGIKHGLEHPTRALLRRDARQLGKEPRLPVVEASMRSISPSFGMSTASYTGAQGMQNMS